MKRFPVILFSLFTLLAATPAAGGPPLKTVALPLTIDYPLLGSLVVYHAFSGPSRSVVVLDEGDGCNFIRISNPVFSQSHGFLRCEIRVLMRTGAPFRDACLMPVEWTGYVALLMTPHVDPQGRTLSFSVTDSAVYDKNHNPQMITEMLWNLIKTRIYDYIQSISVDLEPPFSELKSVIASFIPGGLSDAVAFMLESMRLGEVRIEPKAVRIDILAEVPAHEIEPEKTPTAVSEKELETIIEAWETWDAFLVHTILSLAGRPLAEKDRRTLFETLLDTRYRFTTELSERTLGKDLVREEFIEAWSRLSPIFRNTLGSEASKFTLAYLSFFTAADALTTLDRIGPALGIEISREGLIRLGRLVSHEKPVFLDYDLRFNRQLRELLGLDGSLPVVGDQEEGTPQERERPLEKGASHLPRWNRLLSGLRRFFRTAPAWAMGRKNIPDPSRLHHWLPPRGDLRPFIFKMEKLLTRTTAALLKKSALHRVYHDFFKRLVLSTAWQESCFRQFVRKKGKITYLISYNQSSVGLMQVNKRVWRGIYDIHSLMWNIHYNAAAGCEILQQYLTRYALPRLRRLKNKALMTEETVAGTVYAMYNGGPKQLRRYLKRKRAKRRFKSDRLFLKKFRLTTKGRLFQAALCLR